MTFIGNKDFVTEYDLPEGERKNIVPILRGKEHLSAQEETEHTTIRMVRLVCFKVRNKPLYFFHQGVEQTLLETILKGEGCRVNIMKRNQSCFLIVQSFVQRAENLSKTVAPLMSLEKEKFWVLR